MGMFPSLKGRFQSSPRKIKPQAKTSFPSLKGRFQRASNTSIAGLGESSFHPSKEGFKAGRARNAPMLLRTFPSLKGRFQSSGSWCRPPTCASVSIPQRKVSKGAAPKEDYEARTSFHPSKEGFKEWTLRSWNLLGVCFHPSKEGFKAETQSQEASSWQVSIPQRKVSKTTLRVSASSGAARFHPSKEGFKGHPPPCRPRFRELFPSLKGRFQRRRGRPPGRGSPEFPSLKGRFQSSGRGGAPLEWGPFPSLKGRFQSRKHTPVSAPVKYSRPKYSKKQKALSSHQTLIDRRSALILRMRRSPAYSTPSGIDARNARMDAKKV